MFTSPAVLVALLIASILFIIVSISGLLVELLTNKKIQAMTRRAHKPDENMDPELYNQFSGWFDWHEDSNEPSQKLGWTLADIYTKPKPD